MPLPFPLMCSTGFAVNPRLWGIVLSGAALFAAVGVWRLTRSVPQETGPLARTEQVKTAPTVAPTLPAASKVPIKQKVDEVVQEWASYSKSYAPFFSRFKLSPEKIGVLTDLIVSSERAVSAPPVRRLRGNATSISVRVSSTRLQGVEINAYPARS